MAGKDPGMKQRAVNELVRAYRSAAGQVRTILSSLSPQGFNAIKGAGALKRVDKVIDRLNRTAQAWAKREIPAAYKKSRTVTVNRLATFGDEKNPRFKASRHARAQEKAAAATMRDLTRANRTIRSIARKYVSIMGQASKAVMSVQALTGDETATIKDWAAEAVQEGTTRQELRIRIMEYLQGQLSDGKYIAINGRNYKLSSYAELVASFNLRDAASDAVINSMNEYDHDLVEIPKKGGSCERCKEIEGKIYSLSGTDSRYPKLTDEERPPIHPHCEHYLRAVSAGGAG